jgi:hypothetical protein
VGLWGCGVVLVIIRVIGFKAQGLGSRCQGSGYRVQGYVSWVYGLGYRVEGFKGFRD